MPSVRAHPLLLAKLTLWQVCSGRRPIARQGKRGKGSGLVAAPPNNRHFPISATRSTYSALL